MTTGALGSEDIHDPDTVDPNVGVWRDDLHRIDVADVFDDADLPNVAGIRKIQDVDNAVPRVARGAMVAGEIERRRDSRSESS